MDNVQLEFEENAIDAIAQEAHSRKTGARALRGIVEELMLDLMYNLPSEENVNSFVITKAMVEEHKGGKILSIQKNKKQEEKETA